MKLFKADHTHLFYQLESANFPYKPPSYTCVQEFVNSFPKRPAPEFTASPELPEPYWQPEAPYPRIYTDSYKKTLLSAL